MKSLKVDKKILGLYLLVGLLALMVGFSVDRALAPSVDPRLGADPAGAAHSGKAPPRLAMLPYELTPPGEETPVDTPTEVATPVPTTEGN